MKVRATIVFLFVALSLSAQIRHPKASPMAILQQQVGLTTVQVAYSRPAVKGRKIFGDLVPYGRIWRVGANESTKFTIDSDISVLGNKLPQGNYALYAFPEENAWQVVFHKNTTHWGDGRKAYDPSEDALRVTIVPEIVDHFQENFLITFDHFRHDGVHMIWAWANTRITIPIAVNTHALILSEIEEKLEENPSAQSYYEAARYLQEQQTDYRTALGYLNKALELGGDTYYFHRVKSLVEAALGTYGQAINSAQKSLDLARQEGKDEFVRMNQKNIETWKKLQKESNE